MKRTLIGLVIGFLSGIVFTQYYDLDIDQYFTNETKGGSLSIEHNFRFDNRPAKFDKVLLQITKYHGSESLISTYNIPKANTQYPLDVDQSEVNNENDYDWVLYKNGVIHRIPAKPSFLSYDSVTIIENININDIRVVSQEPRLTGKEKAAHLVVVHNYNSYAVKPTFKITYFTSNDNEVWETVMSANTEIPPEDNIKILLQTKSEKLRRAETSNVAIIKVEHLRP